MTYQYIKALHIIFMVTWFAGLFYIPRLFMYHIEALDKPSPEKEILSKQLALMTKRLWYIITWPSLVLCSLFAFALLYIKYTLVYMPWMQVKLGFVVLLYAYHVRCHLIFKKLQQNESNYSTNFMRIWNEGSTIILFAIVFLVILQNAFNWMYGVVGVLGLGALLMLGIKFYKKVRDKNPEA